MRIEKQLNQAKDFLISSINNGWLPYAFHKRKMPSTETTSWAAIALMNSRPDLAKEAVTFILNNQNKDGGWSTAPGIGESDWTSSPAILALRFAKHYSLRLPDEKIIDNALKNGFHHLIVSRMDLMIPVLRLLLLLGAKGKLGLQFGKGWPWTKGAYSWVEPTAYSLMALKFPTLSDKDELTKTAVFHANKFLLDHTCNDGGWNHGAYYCLGEHCPSYSLTTAEALVSLIDIRENEKIKLAVDYLNTVHTDALSAWSLAWSILALDAYDINCHESINQLLLLQNKNGSFGSNFLVTALSILALDTTNGINIFKGNT